MAHVSRNYLSEKWGNAKNDMEKYLGINDETLPDRIDPETVARCLPEIRQNLMAVLAELEKYKY